MIKKRLKVDKRLCLHMVEFNKGKPSFFNSDNEYYFVNVDEEIAEEVRSRNRKTDFADEDDKRPTERSQKDAIIGNLAEVAVKKFFEEDKKLTSKYSKTWKYDLLVNELKIDVKARDYTQTKSKYKDLLVRDRKDNNININYVDYVVQAMVNGTKTDRVYITGFCSGEEASNAEIFDKAVSHRTRKIKHEELTDIEKF